MLPDYSRFLEKNPFGNDAKINFTDGSIEVSRLLLCGHSTFFVDLFTADVLKSDFNLDELTLKDFKVFYEYIFRGDSFEINGDNIMSLLTNQKHYNVLDLENKLKSWVMDEKNMTFVGIMYENSRDTKLQEMHAFKAFDSFEDKSILGLFNKDFNKDKNQEVVLDIISSWVEFDYANRKGEWLNLLMQIYFDTTPPAQSSITTSMFGNITLMQPFLALSDDYIANYTKTNLRIYENPAVSQFFVSLLVRRLNRALMKSGAPPLKKMKR
uniref:BTB domain-containing protein n=1 Tax=Rhabditophanes sp. KR3021 TaxID=114890 RepID=A0AC35TV23_9BILA